MHGTQRPVGEPGKPELRSRVLVIFTLVAATIAAILLVVVTAAGGEDEVPLDSPTAADVAGNPALYAGQEVTVTGEAQAVYELPRADPGDAPRPVFAMATGVDGGLLVVPAWDVDPPQVTEGERLRAEGTVQGFFAGGFRGVFGELPAGFPFGAAERPVLLATEMSEADDAGESGS